jgi:SLOG in TRPM, prokaryote
MEVMGEAVAELGHQSPLIGVAPAALVQTDGPSGSGRVPLDPNHSHVVLCLGEQWGDERDTLLGVAATLARGRGIVTVVAGGGAFTRQEVLEAVCRRWPIILLEGTGGTAEEIAALVRARPDSITDPALGAIVRDGAVSIVPLAGSPKPLAERIRRWGRPARTTGSVRCPPTATSRSG